MAPLVLLLLAASTASLSLARSVVTPVEKVIDLLTKLKEEVETQGKSEAATYHKFSCFCKDKSNEVSERTTKGQDNIGSLSSTIELKTAEKADRSSAKKAAEEKVESLTQEIAAHIAQCQKDKEEYDAENADVSKAISALAKSIQVLSSSNKVGAAGLLAVQATVQKNLALAEAMKLINAGPKWSEVTAFLQTKVDPDDAEYKFHSHGIIKVMQMLEKNFGQKKAELDQEWAKTKKTCDDIQKDLEAQKALQVAEANAATTAIEDLTKVIAATRGNLIEAEAQMKDDQLYMTDLTALCEKRAAQWDQRTVLRAGEVKVLGEALAILTGTVSKTDSVNKRALLQKQEVPVGSVSFLQEGRQASVHRVGVLLQSRGTVSEAQAAASTAAEKQRRTSKALDILRNEGARLSSMLLQTLGVRAVGATADPFTKVKTLIQDLIERLLTEATEEATKKGFCDKDLSEASQTRTFAWDEVQKLNSELRTLEATKLKLELESKDLKAAVVDLQEALKEATETRKKEHDQNVQDIETADEGLKAITEAILIMKVFYKGAAKSEALAQTHASPVDEDSPGAGFDGAYRGKQEGATGIMGLLEVIKSDYERTLHVTGEEEEEAEAEFVKFDRSSRGDISAKSTKADLDDEDISEATNNIMRKMKEMTAQQDIVDKSLKNIEDLAPMCIDTGMSYKERVDKRNAEIVALKKALCALDTESQTPEPQCEN